MASWGMPPRSAAPPAPAPLARGTPFIHPWQEMNPWQEVHPGKQYTFHTYTLLVALSFNACWRCTLVGWEQDDGHRWIPRQQHG